MHLCVCGACQTLQVEVLCDHPVDRCKSAVSQAAVGTFVVETACLQSVYVLQEDALSQSLRTVGGVSSWSDQPGLSQSLER